MDPNVQNAIQQMQANMQAMQEQMAARDTAYTQLESANDVLREENRQMLDSLRGGRSATTAGFRHRPEACATCGIECRNTLTSHPQVEKAAEAGAARDVGKEMMFVRSLCPMKRRSEACDFCGTCCWNELASHPQNSKDLVGLEAIDAKRCREYTRGSKMQRDAANASRGKGKGSSGGAASGKALDEDAFFSNEPDGFQMVKSKKQQKADKQEQKRLADEGNCHNCGKSGHYATDCRGPGGAKENKTGGDGKGGGKNFDCFNCGRPATWQNIAGRKVEKAKEKKRKAFLP